MASWTAWKKRFYGALLLSIVCTEAAVAVPVLSIAATPDPALAGSSVVLDVRIANVADLYAYQYTLSFNPAFLQAVSVTDGGFLVTGGSTYFGGGTINNTTGSVQLTNDALVGATAGVSGGGVLARMSFAVTRVGSSALTFSDVLFLDSTLADITVQTVNRTLVAVPEPSAWLLFGAGIAGLAGFGAARSRSKR